MGFGFSGENAMRSGLKRSKKVPKRTVKPNQKLAWGQLLSQCPRVGFLLVTLLLNVHLSNLVGPVVVQPERDVCIRCVTPSKVMFFMLTSECI